MPDLTKCSKGDCDKLAVIVSGGLCFRHIKLALFGGKN